MIESILLLIVTVALSIALLVGGQSGSGLLNAFKKSAPHLAVLVDRNLATGTDFYYGTRAPFSNDGSGYWRKAEGQ